MPLQVYPGFLKNRTALYRLKIVFFHNDLYLNKEYNKPVWSYCSTDISPDVVDSRMSNGGAHWHGIAAII